MIYNNRRQQAKILRIVRKTHRTTGILLFIFFFIVAVTGFLLGWKKNSNEFILPATHKGTSTDLKDWLSIYELNTIADSIAKKSIDSNMSLELDRIDIRKKKGIVKFIYKENRYGIQLDGSTGKPLSIKKRYSDIIENMHDGSIIDHYFNTKGYFKLLYTTIMSLALLIFTITGFWLWYGPKRMRRSKD